MAVCIPDPSSDDLTGSSVVGMSDSTNFLSAASGSIDDEYMQLENEFPGAVAISTGVNVLSLLGFAFILVTYLLFPPVRKQHSSLLVWVALMGMLYHGTVLTQTSATFGTCCSTAPLVQIALLAHELYFFALAFNFYFTTKFPFRSSRWLNPIYHIVVWVISAAVTIVAWQMGTGRVSSYGFCWYAAENDSYNDDGEFFLLKIFYIPVSAGYCVSIGCYILATKRVRLTISGKTRTNLDLMRSFLFCSFSLWIVVTIPFILRHRNVVTTNSFGEKTLRFIGRLAIASLGFGSAILWTKSVSTLKTFKLWRQRNWDDYFKVYDASWVLRRNILYFATQGIQQGAGNAKGTPENESVNPHTESIFSFTQLSGIFPWQLRLGAVSQTPSVISFELESNISGQKAIFRDFEPEVFHEIRRMAGITRESYMQSFEGSTRERFSEGKSGSFLYYTGDQTFILKTCTPAEQKYLLYILPQYMAHLRRNPSSYLCRYVGCHELVMEHHSVLFIVLTNILNNPTVNIDELYDLKGAWVGRHRGDSPSGTQRVCKFCGHDFVVGMSGEVCSQNPNAGYGHTEFVVGKDLNWSCRRLGLPIDVAEQLGSQLYADTEFLQRMNSMDYSLVIGLSRQKSFSSVSGGGAILSRSGGSPLKGNVLIGGNSSDEAGYMEFMSPNGSTFQGLRLPKRHISAFSTDACVVNMGIIDILTPWSCKKSLERWMRVNLQCRDAKGVSCMKPVPYADRFRRNVIDTVIFGRRLGCKKRLSEKKQGESIMVDFSSMSMDVNFSIDIANLSMDTMSNLSMEI
ncbi:Phosphatidylinositol 4-phosphate 5-kinase D4 (PIPK-D4/GPCR-PIPK/PiGK4) [Plasmopara halstedii]|uniref:Phosphatidylinositol 4-phosphate 5-kinase D4 (PIPK-D4/GPCR-PIPK/PiGK4) n=1 Tax=Plasmopara halstedii TaxID=4781 RepID=A0A0P1AI03_PLAHL|nr:Phosphatidylinositol 4-phosphate 5-kinase D4 (PIPK-D4/GPCR-PIPK/PiGK4) [Plasmopara halstedii]CEG40645.1 Phosphatidylinositol 4-phosphate 5-kinase D4 (PIPK-D4/GPCR-PIPK/PiGK4) [Plasmopara halstedii]|eukprot:XP_024577014.1 Phosphatidylinositol 4-phosphate 5-kinase D4 (PIPK-D4/GPCR-PIPK/PiGK4) [Plasmopara halstedii]